VGVGGWVPGDAKRTLVDPWRPGDIVTKQNISELSGLNRSWILTVTAYEFAASLLLGWLAGRQVPNPSPLVERTKNGRTSSKVI
jgi:hypothetical protein